MEGKTKRTDRKTLGILWLMILAGCLLVFHNYLLGNETLVFSDVGSDTRQQYIMWYNGIVNHLREGSFSTWDFNNGFGANNFILNLTEPFLMLIYLLGTLFGPEHIPQFMVYLQILKMLLAGTACYYFLSVHPVSERSKLIASFIYAFNGFLMVWGQHYQMGTFVVLLPLLLMFIEKTLQQWRYCFGVAAVSGVIMLSGFYHCYMIMLGCGIYVCIRVLLYDDRPWKKKWCFFCLEAFSMGFGVLMGALNLLPGAAAVVGGSSRLDSDTSLLGRLLENCGLWPREYYRTVFYRLFGENLQGSGNQFVGYANYYEAANLFFSTLFIILLFQYIFTIHRQSRTLLQKIAQYLGIAAGAFTVLIKVGSLVFNGFAYPFSRQTFLLMPFFALLCAHMLDQILEERNISWKGLVLSGAVIAAVYAKAYVNMSDVNYRSNALMLFLTGIAMAVLLGWSLKKNADQRICCGLLLLALFVNVISDATLCYRYRDTLKKEDETFYQETYHSDVNRALAWLEAEDDSFYRVEKDYHTASGCMDSLAQNYMGVSTYNSTQNRNISEFVAKLWPQLLTGYDANHYQFSNTVREYQMASLAGVKYLLSKSGDLQPEGYELYHQIGEIYIYRNTGTDSIGKFFTKTVNGEDYESRQDDLDTWLLLGDVLIVDQETDYEIDRDDLQEYEKESAGDLLDRDRIDETVNTVTEDGIEARDQHFIYLPLKQEELEQYEAVTAEFTLTVDVGTEIEIRMDGQCPNVRNVYAGSHQFELQVPKGTEEITIQITGSGVNASVSDLEFYGTKTAYGFSEHARIEVDAPEKDSYVTGTISTDQDGIVMLAIPYENGWSVYLNGEKQELIRGDYGFLAFETKAGDYELEAVFRAPLLTAGAVVSVVTWILWAAGLAFWLLAGKKQNKRIEAQRAL